MNNVKLLPALLIFVEVANQESFTDAAKQLGLSKSAVSQQIKKLEQEVGQQLLSRNTRGLSLTPIGKKLLGRCELLKDQVGLAFEELDRNKEMPSGTFSITIPHSFEKGIVIPALRQLCNEYPGIQPEINVSDTPKDLIRGKFDVAIYGGELKDSNYRALPIGNTGEFFCASQNYLFKNGIPTTLHDLQDHRMIATPWQKGALPTYDNNDLVENTPLTPRFFSKSNTLSSVLEMVLNDMGCALLPEFYIQSEIADGQLQRILPDRQGRQWPFYLVHRFHGEKPVHVTRFHQLVTHYFSQLTSARL